MNIDVPAEGSCRFYNELIKNLHFLPDNWKVAASGIRSYDSSVGKCVKKIVLDGEQCTDS